MCEGDTFAEYGFQAHVLDLPGHSKGSIGILTAEGNLFCGDLLMNIIKPGLQMYIDDLPVAQASLAKLKKLPIRMIYPGHGNPFTLGVLR